jgi:integrase
MPPAKPSRREYGTGSITWLSPRRARLRIRVPGETGQRTKVVRVAPKDKGGIGEAKAELERFVAELAVGTPTERTTVTVSEMLQAYLAHCKRVGRTQSTIESYQYSMTRVPTALGSLPLTQLTSHHLDTLYGDLAERLGDNTIRQTHAILTAALEQALKWGWIEDNPAKGATAPGRHRPKRKALALTDIARMVAAASTPRKNETDGDVVLAMAIAMAALTGARRGELCGMQWSDIDPATCSITIERQWVPGKGGQYLAPPKSEDGVRLIVLGQLGLGLIERYRDIMREMLRREPEGWLLSYDAGATPLRAKALGQAIAGLGKGLGLDVTTHSFRRVSATQLVAAGIDVDTAARRMGHTKEVMLASYVLGADDRSIAAAQTIESRLVAQGLPLGNILGGEPETVKT